MKVFLRLNSNGLRANNTQLLHTSPVKCQSMIYKPPHASHTREHKRNAQNIRHQSRKKTQTHSVQQVDLLLQLPDEVVFVLVGLQQPDVLLTLSGQLLTTHTQFSNTLQERPIFSPDYTRFRKV